jgi:hypothetical protein
MEMKVGAALVGQTATSAPGRQARLQFQVMAGVDAGRRPGGPPHFQTRLFSLTFV